MKRVLAAFIFLTLVFSHPVYAVTGASPSDEEVCFSPGGQCTKSITKHLRGASHSIKMQAYSFTSKPIAEALIEAGKRGVTVEVILDDSQLRGKGNKAGSLVSAGIPVWIDSKHAIAHDKVMIIDGVTVITGSFNFTNAAEDKNAENVLIMHNKKVASKYRANWYRHKKHSRPYPAKQTEAGKAVKKKKAPDK